MTTSMHKHGLVHLASYDNTKSSNVGTNTIIQTIYMVIVFNGLA